MKMNDYEDYGELGEFNPECYEPEQFADCIFTITKVNNNVIADKLQSYDKQ